MEAFSSTGVTHSKRSIFFKNFFPVLILCAKQTYINLNTIYKYFTSKFLTVDVHNYEHVAKYLALLILSVFQRQQ